MRSPIGCLVQFTPPDEVVKLIKLNRYFAHGKYLAMWRKSIVGQIRAQSFRQFTSTSSFSQLRMNLAQVALASSLHYALG